MRPTTFSTASDTFSPSTVNESPGRPLRATCSAALPSVLFTRVPANIASMACRTPVCSARSIKESRTAESSRCRLKSKDIPAALILRNFRSLSRSDRMDSSRIRCAS